MSASAATQLGVPIAIALGEDCPPAGGRGLSMLQWQRHTAIAETETLRIHDKSAKVVEVPVPVVQEEIVHAGFSVRS